MPLDNLKKPQLFLILNCEFVCEQTILRLLLLEKESSKTLYDLYSLTVILNDRF